MTTQTANIEKEAAAKMAVTNAKVAAMSLEQREARVDELYSLPESELTPEATAEFFAIMFGGATISK
jgi:hypothetical protein